MTDITQSRPVRRKVYTTSGQPLMIEVAPEGIYLREPRRRQRYLLPFAHAHLQAVRLEVDRQRREKLAERKERKKARRR